MQTAINALLLRQVVNGRPLPSATDGKLRKAFAIRRMMSADVTTRQAFAVRRCVGKVFSSLPSAIVGKLTKLASLPGSTVACHVSSLPSAVDGKETFAVGG